MATLRLEVFRTTDRADPDTVVTDLQALEDEKLAAYEKGYAAGWEDAVSAQSDDRARLGADIAHNLQSLGFTFHEARTHVLRAIEPLLHEMVAQLLPRLARDTLGPIVLETLRPLAEELAGTPVKLVFNPAARPALEAVLATANSLPLILTEEATLGEGQVFLQLGDAEVKIDLDRAILDILTAVQGFFDIATKDQDHG